MTRQSDPQTRSDEIAKESLRLHAFYKGKVQILPKCSIRDNTDFAVWYTPGVAAPCLAIRDNPLKAYDYTNKANSVAIVSDGSRVLGLGNIGPEAGLPVMEGKALLFKYLGGVDAVPICVRATHPEALIDIVQALEPSFGGINLEDIAQPKCFRVLDRLRSRMGIPVWHDDQQGTATVLVAGLTNALDLVNKRIDQVQIAMIGMGAANVAVYRLIKARGVDISRIVACDSTGTLHKGRKDIEEKQEEYADKWAICNETNQTQIQGGIAEALRGSDVCVAFSCPGPGVIEPEWVGLMANDAVVFACANPVPEIWPWQARDAGARIVATGRGDLPNQLNNSLAFPGIFRGVLDICASTVTDEMAVAAATELAQFAQKRGIRDDNILPRMEEWEVFPKIAVATAIEAQRQGVARIVKSRESLFRGAVEKIRSAREGTRVLMREQIIGTAPRTNSPAVY